LTQCEIYALRSNRDAAEELPGIQNLFTWKDVERINPDIAFITNPTCSHIDYAIKFAKLGCSLFIEKPIDCKEDSLNDLLKIVKGKEITSYVAYNLRFSPVIQELKSYTRNNNPIHFRASCSSYLPQWRPGQDHKKSYSSIKEQGGGVILDLSHELDYASYILDSELKLEKKNGRLSNITVNSDDYADIRFSSNQCEGIIHLNYFSHKNMRKIEIDYDNSTVIADLNDSSIEYYKYGRLTDSKRFEIDRDYTYIEQLKYFLSNINNTRMENNFFEASCLFRELVK